ncbi:hypothetical protein SJAG_00862 [Schizosaccharomyces japonicus yFS275]|uniref:Uncharacterized protein n=1 Tax=Schizosaccharomyces japonicus (strain yFS275 / FY16936) TaxID=402676 RepID=B6JWT7_SCHJY|nr:hypothetical protein SJAG_00862 [Schizosaccharomyces japonicus yFS275]EEB05838.1 hypothetical protein SJAG_00862 [Schizosaccharomyces japonicus yFS275]
MTANHEQEIVKEARSKGGDQQWAGSRAFGQGKGGGKHGGDGVGGPWAACRSTQSLACVHPQNRGQGLELGSPVPWLPTRPDRPMKTPLTP